MMLTEQDKNLVASESQIALSVAQGADLLHIQNEEQYTQAADTLNQVQSKLKALEDMRKSVTQPLNKALREFNAFFKEPKERYGTAKAKLQQRMVEYKTAQERKQQEALQAAQQASTQEQHFVQAQVAHQALAQHAPNIHFRESVKFEVQDIRQVPLDFLMVDERAVREFIKKHEDTYSIPGIRLYREKQVISRGV